VEHDIIKVEAMFAHSIRSFTLSSPLLPRFQQLFAWKEVKWNREKRSATSDPINRNGKLMEN
jgi:hypothetical protein